MTADIDPFRLRELTAWRNADPPLSLFDYLSMEVGFPALVSVVSLLRPRFRLERGCVLLDAHYEPSNLDLWWNELGGDRPRVEAVINHVHLWDLFAPDADDPAAEPLLQSVAEEIAASWRCVLAESFPNRAFQVIVGSDQDEYGPTVTFHSM